MPRRSCTVGLAAGLVLLLAGTLAPAAALGAPAADTTAAGTRGWTSAVVNGRVGDPDGTGMSWVFEYWTGAGPAPATPLRSEPQALPDGAAQDVSTELGGLQPATTYSYRVVLLVGDGPPLGTRVDGDIVTVTTLPAADPLPLAQAAAAPGLVTGAGWEVPPSITETTSAVPYRVLATPLAGFPLAGPTAALLTTGDASGVEGDQASLASTSLGPRWPARGLRANDVTSLRVDVDVPPGRSCLSFAFRFLSEEFPDYVGSAYNDAFIAEADASTWTAGDSGIAAAGNFAFAPGGEPVSVNGAGPAAVSAAAALGTVFNGATGILRASAPITPGPHRLYLSIFDQTDSSLDSAVIIDRIEATTGGAAQCVPGVVDDAQPPPGAGTGTAGTGSPPPPGTVPSTPGAPTPVLGRTVVGALVSGTVTVKPPGGRARKLGPGEPVPLGSTVDARRGRVRITAADGRGGTMEGVFWGGIFRVTQPAGTPVTTDLRLTEDVGLGRCPRRPAGARGAARRKPGKRLAWGDAKGRFRTSGNHAAAIVRGTRWRVEDSCAGTRVTVARGVVGVRDLTRRRTVTVRAPRSYLARPPRR